MLFGLCKCCSCLRGEQEDKIINVYQWVTASLTHKLSLQAGRLTVFHCLQRTKSCQRAHFANHSSSYLGTPKHFQKSYLFCCHWFNHKLLNVVDGDLNSRRVVIIVFFSAQELVSSLVFRQYYRSLFRLKLDLPDVHQKAINGFTTYTCTHTDAEGFPIIA